MKKCPELKLHLWRLVGWELESRKHMIYRLFGIFTCLFRDTSIIRKLRIKS
jgi:hypothetical protein